MYLLNDGTYVSFLETLVRLVGRCWVWLVQGVCRQASQAPTAPPPTSPAQETSRVSPAKLLTTQLHVISSPCNMR